LRSAFPTLTPAQVNNYLQEGAAPIGVIPNETFGYGRVDALGALAMIPPPTISGPQGVTIVGGISSPPLPFTIGGTGKLSISVVPSVGSMGAAVSPSTCGNPATSCTLTLTPAVGTTGASTVQVTVTDGANRTQSVQVPVTVTTAAPPTITITSGATQSIVADGTIAPIIFTLTGTAPLTVTPFTNSGSSITFNTGCGTTTMICTANLGSAPASLGPMSVLLNVQDSYGQIATGSATLMITTPPAPTIAITSGGNQSVTVSGTIAPVTFTLTGTAPLAVVTNTNDIGSITITAGCGTTTMICTAILGSAGATAGTSTLALTVEDNYAQSASTSIKITEIAAPGSSAGSTQGGSGGGGGALDPWALLGLSGLILLRVNSSQRKSRTRCAIRTWHRIDSTGPGGTN
jgi:hypothetical protein